MSPCTVSTEKFQKTNGLRLLLHRLLCGLLQYGLFRPRHKFLSPNILPTHPTSKDHTTRPKCHREVEDIINTSGVSIQHTGQIFGRDSRSDPLRTCRDDGLRIDTNGFLGINAVRPLEKRTSKMVKTTTPERVRENIMTDIPRDTSACGSVFWIAIIGCGIWCLNQYATRNNSITYATLQGWHWNEAKPTWDQNA